MRGAVAALALVLSASSALADDSLLLSFDRTTPLAMEPSDTLLVTGTITSTMTGALDPAAVFDLEGGGLEAAPAAERDRNEARPTSRFRLSGRIGAACAAAQVSSPCLVPRLSDAAHLHLMTTAELLRTLSGSWTIEIDHGGAAAVAAPPRSSLAAPVAGFGAVAAFVAAALGTLRRRKRTPIGDVYAAALAARKATRKDVTLVAVRAQIDELVTRAEILEAARIESRTRLASIDRSALERKRDAWSRSPSPDAPDAVAWVTEELAEGARIESDLASSLAGLERIAAALRVLTLRARQHRGTRARATSSDPVDALASELERRDAAISEASRV